MRLIFTVTALALATSASAQTPSAELLHPMFQDHAVLQRDRPVPVYGQAAPNTTVTVSLGPDRVQARAGADGQWRAELPAMPAGGPYTLEARSSDGADQVAHDVLVGDVFLCGGQSNMQFAVRAAADAPLEMRQATDSQVRMLTVTDHESVAPLARFADPVSWSVESPETVGAFSATCYFYAREVRKTEKVPIGLVHASWGGSRIRAWISEAGLRPIPAYADDVAMLNLYRTAPQAAERRWDATWEAWWRTHGAAAAGGNPWDPAYPTATWATAPEKLGPWALWTGTSPDGFVGQMWMRTTVRLTAAQAAQKAVLDLGPVNEEDESWVDGHGVGGTSWAHQALHEIPAGVLHAGENTIATNIFCSWRGCGLTGGPETRAIRLADGSSVPLDQPWRYKALPADVIAPQIPWGKTHGVSMDYNGLIAPIGPYAFRAALWYQGESDIHYTPYYQASLTALMADWRRQFGADLPFLIVQLPNYGVRPTEPMSSDLADIREAQRRAAIADRRAGYAVTIDIGDAKVLHPTDKQDVGLRLSILAQRLVYQRGGPGWGPAPGQPYRSGGGVVVPFTNVTGRLTGYSGAPNAFELCGTSQASCRFVPARIVDARTVRLEGGPTGATRVRYCWGDSPTCTLSDTSALPATPFDAPIASGR
jgi:sialate O-acetylesterase